MIVTERRQPRPTYTKL